MPPPSFLAGDPMPYGAQPYEPVFSNQIPVMPPPPPTSGTVGGSVQKYKYSYGHFIPVEGNGGYHQRALEGVRMFGEHPESAFIPPPYLDEEYGINECESDDWNEEGDAAGAREKDKEAT